MSTQNTDAVIIPALRQVLANTYATYYANPSFDDAKKQLYGSALCDAFSLLLFEFDNSKGKFVITPKIKSIRETASLDSKLRTLLPLLISASTKLDDSIAIGRILGGVRMEQRPETLKVNIESRITKIIQDIDKKNKADSDRARANASANASAHASSRAHANAKDVAQAPIPNPHARGNSVPNHKNNEQNTLARQIEICLGINTDERPPTA
jgi:hypothetical protein